MILEYLLGKMGIIGNLGRAQLIFRKMQMFGVSIKGNLNSMKSIVKYLLILLAFVGLIVLAFVFYILFRGEDLYIKSVKEKRYSLIKLCLKINPKLIDTKINEYYYGFDEGLYLGDVTLLEILEPFTKRINAIDKGSGFENSGAIDSCIQRYGHNALEYILKNDLIRKKALFEKGEAYQNYLDFLLRIANDPNKDQCGRILIKYGANPYFMTENFEFCLKENPEYLIECYAKDGLNAFVKFRDLMMRRWVTPEVRDKARSILSEFEKRKDLPSEDLAYIKELSRFLKDDYTMDAVDEYKKKIENSAELR